MLVVVCGVPGVGKTTVARRVADRLDGDLLRTDVVRKELFDEPAYTDEESRRTYEALLGRAERILERGGVAVVDGTFHDRRYRHMALASAAGAGVDHRFVRVECEPAVARQRIRAREGDASDADVAVHDHVRKVFDPLAVAHDTVDNSGPLAATRRQVDTLLEEVPVREAPDRVALATGDGD